MDNQSPSLWQEVRDLARDHVAATWLIGVCVISLLGTYGGVIYELATSESDLHHNICTAVALSARGDARQYEFWTKAAQRARDRSASEAQPLKDIDLDSAKNDLKIAAVFAPHPYNFPGC